MYGRARSDTLTTTSSASSDILQTPQTPTILGVLDRFTASPSVVLKRSDSYGFSRVLEELRDGTGALSDGRPRTQSLVDPLETFTTPFQLAPPLVLSNAGSAHEMHEPSFEAQNSLPVDPLLHSTATSTSTTHTETQSMGIPHHMSEQSGVPDRPLLETMARGSTGADAGPGAKGSHSKIKAAVRRKLERSKSSLKALRSLDEVDEEDVTMRRRPGRLRSLISQSISRSHSSASLRSSVSSRYESRPSTPLPTAPLTYSQADDYAQYVDSGLRPADADGLLVHKARLRVKHRSHSVWTNTAPAEPVLSRPRAQSMPLFKQKKDLFGNMLPRELKVMVLSKLLQNRPAGNGRWAGEIGGRRELIKLSRVSKAWESLCFDGQLWPILDLADFASHLHPQTLRRILLNTGPFVTRLSLRSMESLATTHLIPLLAHPQFSLPNLTTMDLRGCKHLQPADLMALVSGSPRLVRINLKGLRAANSEVLRHLARGPTLVDLDVSRCWDLTIGDVLVFLRLLSPSRFETLRSLRVAGLKSYGPTVCDFMALLAESYLDVLDLTGVLHLTDDGITAYVDQLAALGRSSSLRHLILSSTFLTSDAFGPLEKLLPNVVTLELAGLPQAFSSSDSENQGLIDLIKSMPQLEKLDLEGTGSHGGVTDRLLDAIGEELRTLKIGFAKSVTPEGLTRLVKRCPRLLVLEADNTAANNAVMRAFLNRRGHSAAINLVDCRAITTSAYSVLAPTTRSRNAWTGFAATPFGYEEDTVDKPVLKTFWSWRRVAVPRDWRDARQAGEIKKDEPVASNSRGKRKWWKTEEDWDDRGGCVIM